MPEHIIFCFQDFKVDLSRGCLFRGQDEIKLRPKSFQVLHFLLENPGRLVSKGELISAVWPDTAVTDDSLVQCLIDVRRALGNGGQQILKTVPRRGYIFEANVEKNYTSDVVIYEEEIEGVKVALEESDFSTVAAKQLLPATDPHRRSRWLPGLLAVALVVAGLGLTVHWLEDRRSKPDTGPIRSIAVLPLKNLSADPANEYFSDGMTESLINALSHATDLTVISRGSVMQFKGKDADPRSVGKQLGVMAVLEGSVRKSSDSIRVAVRLVSVEDGRVLWSRDTNERALGDIFALQDEIATNVVAGLKLNLTGERAQQLSRRYTDNIEAYQLYLKGRFFWNKRTAESLHKSIEYFEQSLLLDPNYALAYVGLADSYLVLKSLSLMTPQEAHVKVESALKRALEIDDRLGEAHSALAWARFSYDWNWADAEREFRRAIDLQPSDAKTHQWYAEYLSAMGRFDESLRQIERAQQLEPASSIINVIAAQTYFFGRQYDRAIEQSRKTLELDPSFYIALDYLAWALRQKQMHDEAIAELRKAKEIEDTPLQLLELGISYAMSGNKAETGKIIRHVIEGSKQSHAPHHSYRIARIYAALSEPDHAFLWLDKAFQEREENLVWLKVDPHLDNLRADARFQQMLNRVGFEP